MSFLDVIPFTLFRMLSSPAHVRNVAVLERIFEQFFDDFAFAPKRAEVLQVIQEVLDNPDYRALPDEDVADTPAETAQHIIYNRLRDDGWIMEVANRRNIEVYMPREAHALLSALITLKEELKVDISAESSLIDSGILAAYQDPSGKVMNIASARRQSVETTQVYMHADLRLKEKALARIAAPASQPGRYRPDDTLLAFLEAL